MDTPHDITRLLSQWKGGDKEALDRLVPIVYQDLKQMAKRYLRHERPEHTLQTTALVNEAYMKLAQGDKVNWQDRQHFFRVVARIMRHILVNYALANQAEKRGGGVKNKVVLDNVIFLVASEGVNMEITALNDALEKLAEIDERKSQIVELRYFAGLSQEQTAEALGISRATLNREWRLAKAWLYTYLHNEDKP